MADNMELARLLKSSLSDAHAPVRNDSDLHPYSCATCRRRKVRCDRRDPCSGCIRSNIECVFPERAQRAKRSRATAARLAEADSGSSRLKANHELLDRLQKLEDLVRKQYGKHDQDKVHLPACFSPSVFLCAILVANCRGRGSHADYPTVPRI